jgi:hypothetical protein
MFSFGEKEKRFIHAEGVVAWNRPKSQTTPQGEVLPAGMGIMFTRLIPISSQEFIDNEIKKLEQKNN